MILNKNKVLSQLAQQKMTISDLSEKTGIALGWLCGILNKDVPNVQIKTIAKIGDALGVCPVDLILSQQKGDEDEGGDHEDENK